MPEIFKYPQTKTCPRGKMFQYFTLQKVTFLIKSSVLLALCLSSVTPSLNFSLKNLPSCPMNFHVKLQVYFSQVISQ